MVVPVETDPTFTAGTPEVLFDTPYYFNRSERTYDLAPDGQRFLMVKDAELTDDSGTATQEQIVLVEHWFEEHQRLVPIQAESPPERTRLVENAGPKAEVKTRCGYQDAHRMC